MLVGIVLGICIGYGIRGIHSHDNKSSENQVRNIDSLAIYPKEEIADNDQTVENYQVPDSNKVIIDNQVKNKRKAKRLFLS